MDEHELEILSYHWRNFFTSGTAEEMEMAYRFYVQEAYRRLLGGFVKAGLPDNYTSPLHMSGQPGDLFHYALTVAGTPHVDTGMIEAYDRDTLVVYDKYVAEHPAFRPQYMLYAEINHDSIIERRPHNAVVLQDRAMAMVGRRDVAMLLTEEAATASTMLWAKLPRELETAFGAGIDEGLARHDATDRASLALLHASAVFGYTLEEHLNHQHAEAQSRPGVALTTIWANEAEQQAAMGKDGYFTQAFAQLGVPEPTAVFPAHPVSIRISKDGVHFVENGAAERRELRRAAFPRKLTAD